MKNSLMVPVVFLANLVIWSVLAAFFSVLSSSSFVLFLSAGKLVPIMIEMMWNVVQYLPFTVSVALLITLMYLMRHKTYFFVSVPIVLGIVFASLIWIIPLSYTGQTRLSGAHADVFRLEGLLSETTPYVGHIQRSVNSSRVVWLSESSGGRVVRPLVAVRQRVSEDDAERVVSVYDTARFSAKSMTITAVLSDATTSPVFSLQNGDSRSGSYGRPRFISAGIDGIALVLDGFSAARSRGSGDFNLVVGAFLLAVLSLAFISRATGWRLLNLFFSCAFFSLFFILYRFTCSGPFFDILMRFLPSSIPARLISPFLYISFAALVCLIGSLIGLWRITHRSKYPPMDGAYHE